MDNQETNSKNIPIFNVTFRSSLKKFIGKSLSDAQIDWLYDSIFLDGLYKLVKRSNKLLKKKKILPWVPNKTKIEIEITTDCNLACFNCDRSCRQAPSKENMSVEQINKFVDESIKLNWKWNTIVLIGGEPTLHPKFFEILKTIKRYADSNAECKIHLVTNGFGQEFKKILLGLPIWIEIINSEKKSIVHEFSSYNVAPTDFKKYKNADFCKGCEITEECGLGLTRYGYYPCGAGAAVDRVFGFDIGLKRLSDINSSALKNQLNLLCKYCGHYKDISIINFDAIKEEKISSKWREAYEKYKKNKPDLSLY